MTASSPRRRAPKRRSEKGAPEETCFWRPLTPRSRDVETSSRDAIWRGRCGDVLIVVGVYWISVSLDHRDRSPRTDAGRTMSKSFVGRRFGCAEDDGTTSARPSPAVAGAVARRQRWSSLGDSRRSTISPKPASASTSANRAGRMARDRSTHVRGTTRKSRPLLVEDVSSSRGGPRWRRILASMAPRRAAVSTQLSTSAQTTMSKRRSSGRAKKSRRSMRGCEARRSIARVSSCGQSRSCVLTAPISRHVIFLVAPASAPRRRSTPRTQTLEVE
mmetsp:Transcript_13457/g.54013  ORF Transcript_13457/g.54013 Transcript_13457/m.54013 type:complete len:274 (+) Transcript_13457:453-1274(+)